MIDDAAPFDVGTSFLRHQGLGGRETLPDADAAEGLKRVGAQRSGP